LSAFDTHEATVEVLAELCGRYRQPRVLDIGCGDGRHLRALAPRIGAGLGIDVSAVAIRAAAEAAAPFPHLEFRVLPVEKLPATPREPFDLALFVGSLEHMADPRAALEAAHSRLHADGRMVVVAIAPQAPHAILSRLALRRSPMPVVGHLGVEGVRRLAAGSGLRIEEARPLRRGTARRPWLRPLLAAYDRLGGPTQAVILEREQGPPERTLS
jgi:SAM-dependent methyltransferase